MSEEQTITIHVDGQALEAKAGQMLIEVTDAAGITVPRFCYHKNLSIAANCRMCLVEVENAPKPLPACATPCMDGMKVFTRSPLAREAQKGTMEFLLINHPLDCPICDQGGECELQDVALGYGGDVSRFTERKRVVPDPDIGPLVATDMTRCIHCTRCVRFGQEIAGLRELGATGRGEHTTIGTYVAHAMTSELSGNVIDLCPVGALTSKPFRFKARSWEMSQHATIAPHDCVGSSIYVHKRRSEILRVVPKENETVNETWISDRDRYSYTGLEHPDRLTVPMVRDNGKWSEATWEEALKRAADAIAITRGGEGNFGTLVSPSATLEEMALAAKITRAMGSKAIDHRLMQADFRHRQSTPWLGMTLADLEKADAILLVGSNARKEQPLVNHRIRKAALRGAAVMAVNPVDFDFNYPLAHSVIAAPSALAGAIDNADIKSVLSEAGNAVVLVGETATSCPDYSLVCKAAADLALATGSVLGFLTAGANTAGAWMAGAVDADASASIIETARRGWLLVGIEPEFDCIQGRQASEAIARSSNVVALTAWRTQALEEIATVMLPIGHFTETSGTYVNCQGDRQSFAGIVEPRGDARPAWKVLRVLGNLLDVEGMEYNSSEEIRDEVFANVSEFTANSVTLDGAGQKESAAGLERIATPAPYMADGITRRATPLHATVDASWGISMSPATASNLGLAEGDSAVLKQGEGSAASTVILDERVPDNCVWYPGGVPGSEEIGGSSGTVTVEKAS
ncbi:MAG: NADH-quinone oxidoreductase subunit NuoG [Chromatiales bacterium]|jgi:NADH-quinone oxidoreductase subunit G